MIKQVELERVELAAPENNFILGSQGENIMNKINKKILLYIFIIIILISAIVYLLFSKPDYILKIFQSNKSNTYLYDRNNSEIAVIPYGDTTFFDNIKSYYLASALEEILDDIKEKENISEEDAEKKLATSESKIYTCMDFNIQKKLEEIYANNDNFENDKESSSIVLDNISGETLAIVGGRNKENKIITFGMDKSNFNLNRATESLRQPGPMLSLISVYAYGLNNGTFTLNSKYLDTPIENSKFQPKNYYVDYKGELTIKEAIEYGSNIIKIKALQSTNIDDCFEFVKKLNIPLTDEDKNIASLALGGLTKGCTLLEISAAYRTILTDGTYKKSCFYSKILDKNNNIYLANQQDNRKIVTLETCNDIKSCIKSSTNNETLYLKFGTPNDSKDQWSIVNSTNYTISTWQGYDLPKTMEFTEKEAEILSLKILNSI